MSPVVAFCVLRLGGDHQGCLDVGPHSLVLSPAPHLWFSARKDHAGFGGYEDLLHWWPGLMSAYSPSCDTLTFACTARE